MFGLFSECPFSKATASLPLPCALSSQALNSTVRSDSGFDLLHSIQPRAGIGGLVLAGQERLDVVSEVTRVVRSGREQSKHTFAGLGRFADRLVRAAPANTGSPEQAAGSSSAPQAG